MNMFGHNRNELPYDYSSEFQTHFPLIVPETTTAAAASAAHQALLYPSPPSQLFLPPLDIPGGDNHDPVAALRSEMGYTSSGCSSYGGSPTSYRGGAYSPNSYGGGAYSPTTAILQRSISSHSLHKNPEIYNNNSPMHSSPSPRYFEPEITGGSVKKAMSTGNLQVVNLGQQNSQRSMGALATESSILESMNRANPYSPEEKKERIERYRSKRNLRNFNKKIKYECRKTLADSRPRIRGRFARNDEIIEKNIPQSDQWDQIGIEEDDDEDDDNWIHFLDAFSANLMP